MPLLWNCDVGHAFKLHAWVFCPLHSVPPFWAWTWIVLVCCPGPQVVLQVPQFDHWQFIGVGVVSVSMGVPSMYKNRSGKVLTATQWGQICQEYNVWSIKFKPHIICLCDFMLFFWIILLYGLLVYFILKVLAWIICNMKWGFAKKIIITKSQRFKSLWIRR